MHDLSIERILLPGLDDGGAVQAAYASSKQVQAADARFDEVEKCQSALFASNPLYDGLPDDPEDDDAVIEFYACSLREGKTAADITRVNESWQSAFKVLDGRDPSSTRFRASWWTPRYATTDRDVFYWVRNDDLESFARAGHITWSGVF